MSKSQGVDDRMDVQIPSTLAQAAAQAGETLKDYAVSVDDYVHDSPWVAIGTAAAAAAALGFIAGTLLASNRRRWS